MADDPFLPVEREEIAGYGAAPARDVLAVERYGISRPPPLEPPRREPPSLGLER